jgi:MFS family permease
MGLVGNGFRTSNNVAALSHVSKASEEKLKAMNVLAVVYNLALTVAGALISLISSFNFTLIFLAASLTLFLALLYLSIIERQSKLTPNFVLECANADTIEVPESEYKKTNKAVLYTVLSCLLLFGFFIAQLNTTYPVYIHKEFSWLGLKSFGYLFILNPIIIILFQASIGHFVKSFNKVLLVGIGIFLYGFGLFLLDFTFSFYSLAILSCLIYTFGEMIFFPPAQLLVYQHGAAHKKGQALGIFQATYSIGIGVGPALGGLIYYHLGGDLLWGLVGALGALCLLACLLQRGQVN